MADCIIAGGTESMSLVPTAGWKTVPAYSIAKDEPDYYLSMGLTAEAVAKEFKVSREDQDAFAYQSHQKAIAAMKAGKFKDEIVPVAIPQKKGEPTIFAHDEGYRADASMDTLAKLRPLMKEGTVTAGNASGVNDGAAALLLADGATASALGLQPQARVLGYATAGIEPRVMGFGPTPAVHKLLAQTGLSVTDFDVVELNEAFAAQGLAVLRALGLPDGGEHINPNGGAIAYGHPLGMSGARLAWTAVRQLHRTGGRYDASAMDALDRIFDMGGKIGNGSGAPR